jgi:hypothetical protein
MEDLMMRGMSVGLLALGVLLLAARPAPADEPAPGDDRRLGESEREFLWHVEHGGNLLVRYGFGSLAAALRKADGAALRAVLSDDFKGQVLREPRESAWRSDWLTVVRQTDGGKDPLPLDRGQFVQRLLDYRRQFHKEPKVEISLMTLCPKDRETPEGAWQGTCQLRLWGEKAPGQPCEVIAYLSYRVRRPTEEGLKDGGWLSACAIAQSQVGHAKRFLMREVAAARGLDVASLYDNDAEKNKMTVTGGVYLCDYNRDGILDMLVTDVKGIWLYKGLPGGKFQDVTRDVRLPRRLGASSAVVAAFVDIDGDGWDDLILGDSIYKNEGGKSFTDYTGRCNLRLPPRTTGITVGDYDRDGRLDLYVTRTDAGNSVSWYDVQSKNKGNQLWRNKGDWQFEDVTARANAGGGRRSSFSAVWLDANNDGWPDLYVPNEFGNGVLLVNQRDGTFKEHALTDGPGDFGTMGVTAGDIDNDGNIDLYLANMYSKAGKRVIDNLRPDAYPRPVMAKMRTFVTGSQLHRNLGGLKFEQKGQEWQVHDCGWAYGAALIDLDNDGWLDLFATAGFSSQDRTKPDADNAFWLAVVAKPPGSGDPNLFQTVAKGHNFSAFERSRTFMNVRGGNFLDVSYLSGADNDGDGRCVVAGDFRNIGRLDVVVRKVSNGVLQLYENDFPQRHYLKVSLRGTRSNRQGVGARLVAVVNGQQIVREMYPLNSYRSQMPNIVHFGLGDRERVERLTIRWPSGEEQVLTDLAGDRHVVIEQGKDGSAAVETVVPGRTVRP